MAHFELGASYWNELYLQQGLEGEIFRARQAKVLSWIDALHLTSPVRALDVGSGAGYLTLALAARGFDVVSVDPSPSMLRLTRDRAAASQLADKITVQKADVQDLPFRDHDFDLIVALGVIAWVPSPKIAFEEMSRVLKPGGHILVTAGNAWQLTGNLDPRLMPAHAPLRRRLMLLWQKWFRSARGRTRTRSSARLTTYSIRSIDQLMKRTLTTLRKETLGFGPFTLFGRAVFSDSQGIALHRRLQRLADGNAPLIRFAGTHYVVLARKPTHGH